MPTYEYACDRCGHCFEKLQSITAPPLKRCPRCRSKVRRVISGGAGLVFKGAGFYVTDARSSSPDSEKSERSSEKDSTTGEGSSEGEK